MAYSPLPALASGATFSLAVYDLIRENFNVGVPDIFAAKGDLAVGLTTDSAGRLAVGSNGSELTPDSAQATGLAWQIRPCVNAYGNATQALSAGTWTTIPLALERYDTDGMHSTVTNPSRLTVPTNGAGLYSLKSVAEISATGARTVGIRLILNGTTVIAQAVHQSSGTPTQNIVLSPAVDYSLAVANYIEMQGYCDDGSGSVTVQAFSPILCAAWLRRS